MEIKHDEAVEILGLSLEERSDLDSIKRAYRELAKVVHPDLHGDLPSWRLNGLARAVNTAYSVLAQELEIQQAASQPANLPQWATEKRQYEPYTGQPTDPERLEITFSELIKTYSGEPVTKNTTYGRSVNLNIPLIRSLDTIIVDELLVILDNAMANTASLRMSWRKDDSYTANATIEVPSCIRFPCILHYELAGASGDIAMPKRADSAFVVKLDKFIQVRVNLSLPGVA